MYKKEVFNLKTLLGKDICQKARKENAFLCGGAITSLFSGSKINDFDFYFKNSDAVRHFRDELLRLDFKSICVTENAETLTKDKLTIQVIKKPEFLKESIVEIFNLFDFTICMGGFDFTKNEFVLYDTFLYDLSRRELIFNINANYPLSSLCRLQKYINRGYKISAAELIKLSLKIHSLDLQNYKVLKDQLHGVDTLVFKPITDKLEEIQDNPYKFEEVILIINTLLNAVEIGREDDLKIPF